MCRITASRVVYTSEDCWYLTDVKRNRHPPPPWIPPPPQPHEFETNVRRVRQVRENFAHVDLQIVRVRFISEPVRFKNISAIYYCYTALRSGGDFFWSVVCQTVMTSYRVNGKRCCMAFWTNHSRTRPAAQKPPDQSRCVTLKRKRVGLVGIYWLPCVLLLLYVYRTEFFRYCVSFRRSYALYLYNTVYGQIEPIRLGQTQYNKGLMMQITISTETAVYPRDVYGRDLKE